MTEEEKIADLKANFDYVLEGKDVEIKELKETLAQTIENDEVAYETLKLHDQEEIGMLKSRVEELDIKRKAERKIFQGIVEKKNDQLTKAKEHIKQLLDCLKQDTNDPQTNYYVCQYMDKAEQFLKESEVEK